MIARRILRTKRRPPERHVQVPQKPPPPKAQTTYAGDPSTGKGGGDPKGKGDQLEEAMGKVTKQDPRRGEMKAARSNYSEHTVRGVNGDRGTRMMIANTTNTTIHGYRNGIGKERDGAKLEIQRIQR